MPYPYQETVRNLTEICTREVIAGLTLDRSPLRGVLTALLRQPMRRFARALADADREMVDDYLDGCGRG
jgi:hypothetical protein